MYEVTAKQDFLHDQLGAVIQGQELELNDAQFRSIAHLVTEPNVKTKPKAAQETKKK